MPILMRVTRWLHVGLLVLAVPSVAQVRYGDLSTHLNGTLSSGYSATYGNLTNSTHGWNVAGVGTLTGSYYSPNFLSFGASFYLNQSRANSDFQSISNASGLNLTTSIFGGSHFPGSITYSRAYNSQGNYAVPGLSDYVTHGNSNSFGINWSEIIPKAPSLSVGYQRGSSNYTVYGISDTGDNHYHSFHAQSGYSVNGFNMGAYYTRGASKSIIPKIISGDSVTEIKSSNDGEGFSIAHQLPYSGSFASSYSRTAWNTDYLGNTINGTIDIFNTHAAIHPNNRLSFTANANYSTNLAAQYWQSVLGNTTTAGAVTGFSSSSQSSNSLDVMTSVGYAPGANVQTSAYFERRTQEFLGDTYGVRTYGGNVSYQHVLLDGSFNTSVNATANHSENSGTDTLGLAVNANYTRDVLGWKTRGSFGYAQNVQTLLVTYMNSYYHYSGNVRRRWGWFHVSMGAGAARTGLTQRSGSENSSESYNASFGYSRYISANGTYSRSDGHALATGSGLVNVPPGLSSDLVILYGGNSYAFGVSSSPVKNLIISSTYSRSHSNTNNSIGATTNENKQFFTQTQYHFRKLSFNSGYARLEQGFNVTGTQPQVISSYFVGISRWFNFF